MIKTLATSLAYRNPRPHFRAIHTRHPSVSRLADGTLVATFDLGQAVESLDFLTYSTDGGLLAVAWAYSDRPGVWANRSKLEKCRWTNFEKKGLWLGATSVMRGDNRRELERAELKFGYPSMVSLDKNQVFLGFWCEEARVNNLRRLRLRIH